MVVKDILKPIIPVKFRPLIKRIVLRLLYFGNAHYCPVCESRIRRWKPLGYDLPVIREKQITGSGLRNVMCPVCGSSDRVRLLYLFLKSRTRLFTDKIRLLHVAPEDQLKDILSRLQNIDYLTADIDPDKVMEQMDITDIPYPDHSFDAIMCNHVLEHIPNDRQAMNELFRVLKPGGWAILQVPFSNLLPETFEDLRITAETDRERFFGQKDHVRIYGKDYANRLKKSGFLVSGFRGGDFMDLNKNEKKYGLNPEEIVFYCEKPPS